MGNKDSKKQSKKSKKMPDFAKEASDMKDSAIKYLGEVEKSGEKMAAETKRFFEQIANDVAAVASTAAKTTASVTEKVAGVDPVHHLSRVMEEIKEAGESSIHVVVDGFDALRRHILDLTPAVSKQPKKSGGKGASGTKETTGKKVAKKPSVKKKVTKKKVQKRPVVKKRPTAKKRTQSSRKKTAPRKVTTTTAKKKATAKNTAARKPVAKKVAKKKTVKQ